MNLDTATLARKLADALDGDADTASEAVAEWAEGGYRQNDYPLDVTRLLGNVINDDQAHALRTALDAL